jgi:hypothetical protein
MLGKIDEVRQTESPAISTARDEIQRLRASAESQVAQSQALIKRLQEQLANSDTADEVQKAIDEQNERVRSASSEVDRLTEEKIQLESEYRKLEAEVGPIKYIAEFVYGDTADNNMLEEAVRWVIITIIFVFDPLAVLLLIASQYTFEWRSRKDDNGGWLRQYEQLRAQRIIDNPGYNIDDPKETSDEDRKEDSREEQQDAEELRDGEPKESVPSETGDDPVVAETSQEERQLDDTTNNPTANDDSGDMVSEDDTAVADAVVTELEQPEVQSDEKESQIEHTGYVQNAEQNENTKWKSIQGNSEQSEVKDNKAKPKGWTPTRNRFFWRDEHDEVVSKKENTSYSVKEDGVQINKKTN